MVRMMTRTLRPATSTLLAALTLAAGLAMTPQLASAEPLGTTTTYQGQLKNNGQIFSGQADIEFRVFDAAIGGAQVGGTQTFLGVQVNGGLFTIPVNFGSGVFAGDARFIQISFRVSGSGNAYTPVLPRQAATAAPYALFALNAGNTFWQANGSAITNTNTGFVGINRTNRITSNEVFGVQANNTTGFGGMYMRTSGTAAQPFYGYSVNGGIDAFHYVDGNDESKWKLSVGGGTRLTVAVDGNIGIGTTTPTTAKLVISSTTDDGLRSTTNAASSFGVYGGGTSAGVRGECATSSGSGVYGVSNAAGNGGGGVPAGVRGDATAAGVAGGAFFNNVGTALYAQSTSGTAGFFSGNVTVTGNLSVSGTKNFVIDHPLDPANKLLYHISIESDEMLNIYSGTVTTDSTGMATITMPAWCDALNTDFRYQLTIVDDSGSDEFVQAKVARKMKDNAFAIRTSKPNTEVSWQVSGVRHDAWAKANPRTIEVEKTGADKGKFLSPEAFGSPTANAITPFNGR